MAERGAALALLLVACGGRGAEPAARPQPVMALDASAEPEAPPVLEAGTAATEDAGADGAAPVVATLPSSTKLSVTGALDATAVKAQVARHKSLFEACFQLVTLRNPTFRGRALFSFTIDAEGHVGIAHLDASSFGDGHVESCILRQLRAIVFPVRAEPTNVVAFPITLLGSD